MSLASLTVDLSANVSRFESDLGRASQIASRESERVARARQSLTRQLEREVALTADGKVGVLAMKAAYAGLGAEAAKYLDAVTRAGSVKATVPTSMVSAGGEAAKAAAAETAANDRRIESQRALILSISKVSEAFLEQQKVILQGVATQTLSPEIGQLQIEQAKAARDAAIQDIRAKAAQEAAAQALAEEERQTAETRRAAAQRIIDAQNGLTSTYRSQLAALRELRDAGTLSPQQFRQAGRDLVAQQPAVQQRQRTTAAEQEAAARFVQSLQQQANAIGKTRSELLLEEAARRGVTEQVRPYIDRITQAEQSLNKFGRTSGVARMQLMTLQYTISDITASLASGISPFTILLQQGGQVADVFANNGGLGALFRTIGSVFTVARVAIGGTAAAIGAVGYAAYRGAEQSKQLADAVVLSGNAAGVTEGQYNRVARAIAASGEVSVAAAREYGLALIQTGQVGAKNLELATEVATRFGVATGKSAKEVAAQFATLNSDVSQGAAQLNQNLNFLTAAQIQQIRTLQEQGRSGEATAVVYSALNDRLKQLEPNLGTLDRALRTLSTSWSNFWDRAFDIGRTETIDQKIEKARQALENARNIGTERASQTQLDPQRRAQLASSNAGGFGAAEVAAENLRLLSRSKEQQEEAAAAAAELVKLNKAAANADEFVRGEEKRAKAAEGLARALAEANKAFAAQDALAAKDANYKPSSAETRAAILAKIRDDFTDKGANTETNQVAKAQRDAALKAIQDSLKQERDLYDFQNQYLNGLYAQGQVSLETFYKTRRAATERDTQEQLNAIDEQIAVQRRYLDFIRNRDPSEAVSAQKNIDSLNEQAAAIVADRQRKVVLSNLEEAASYRQLQERVVEYRAQLLQLQGDDAGAAKLRAAQAIEAARILAKQSQGSIATISDADIAKQERALQVANDYAEVQRLLGVVTANAGRAEEAALLLAQQRGDSLIETEGAVFAARAQALAQLGTLVERSKELAAASTDPRVQQFAADLALQYAKAADAVDPTLNRLRESGAALGDSLGDSFGRAIKEARSLKDVLTDVINQIKNTVIDVTITDPLKAALRGAIRQSIDAGALQRFGGSSGGPTARNYENGSDLQSTAFELLRTTALSSQAATTLQTSAVTANTAAFTALTAAAAQAASALAAISASSAASAAPSLTSLFGGSSGAGIDYSFGGAGFPLADGTNRIPYDGFKATLHKGEAVVPAKYNPAVGGRGDGGGGVSVVVENHSGSAARVEERSTSNGGREMRVIIDAAVSEVERRMAAGGSTDRVMRQTYAIGRNLARRS